MIKYTWDSIIINPISKAAKYCIGKKVYFANNPSECLRYANKNNHTAKLLDIYENKAYPFKLNDSEYNFCSAIILKLDEIEYYSPFENYGDFDQAFERHTHYINKYGLWIRERPNNSNKNTLCLVTNIWIQGVTILTNTDTDKFISWQELLKGFTFEDGIPCGKLKEENDDDNFFF